MKAPTPKKRAMKGSRRKKNTVTSSKAFHTSRVADQRALAMLQKAGFKSILDGLDDE